MEWRRFVTYLWNDPRISQNSKTAKIKIIAKSQSQNTCTRLYI